MLKLYTHFLLFDAHINNRDVLIRNANKAFYPVSTCSQHFTFDIIFDNKKTFAS